MFDPTQKTNCFIKARRNDHKDVYFPEDYCTTDDYQIAFTNVVTLFNEGLATHYGKHIWIETSFSYVDSRTLKHELGHMLGALDLDFVNIKGNSKFPYGNSYKINDVMGNYDSYEVSEYTRGIIDTVVRSDFNEVVTIRVNQIKLKPNKVKIFSKKITEEELSRSEFLLFGGAKGNNHEAGTSYDEPHCTGRLTTDLVIDLSTCFFKRFPFVAGFVIVKTDSTELKGQFDLIELAVSYLRNEPYYTVELSY